MGSCVDLRCFERLNRPWNLGTKLNLNHLLAAKRIGKESNTIGEPQAESVGDKLKVGDGCVKVDSLPAVAPGFDAADEVEPTAVGMNAGAYFAMMIYLGLFVPVDSQPGKKLARRHRVYPVSRQCEISTGVATTPFRAALGYGGVSGLGQRTVDFNPPTSENNAFHSLGSHNG